MSLQRSTATAPLFSRRLQSTPKRAEFGWDEGATTSARGPRVPCFVPSLGGGPEPPVPPALLETDPRRWSSSRRARPTPLPLQARGHWELASATTVAGSSPPVSRSRRGAAKHGRGGLRLGGALTPPPLGARCIHPPSILPVLLAAFPELQRGPCC
jgi:hypothetical protein